jgi:predicted flap endonuclease-1-like 5' DNA nuclease
MLHRNKTVVGARAMTLSFLPEVPKIDPEKGPNLLAGAASPLWLVFGGAAVAGATWWWWTARWREAVNVEALLAPATAAAPEAKPAPSAVAEPVTEAPVLVAPPVETPAPAKAAVEVAEKAVETVEAVAVETAEAIKVTAEPVAEAAADDLTLLVGVGPKLAASLADLGVTRFSQIAGWSAEDLAGFDKQLNLRGRAERDAWVAQAKRLIAG